MSILLDPKIFNYIIMGLYALNMAQFVVRGFYPDSAYWFFALGITATVTWGYTR
jgi:uncharacterized YccA/Bax inhibitor family protein